MPQPFEPDDLYLYRDIVDLQCRFEGDLAVCELSTPDRDADAYRSALWLVDIDGGRPPRQLTFGNADSHPRWCPGEQALAFLSDRGSGRQIHAIRTDGGEARRVTDLPSGVMSFEWSPDGKQLLALCTIAADPEQRGNTHGDSDEAADRPADAPRVVWRLPYKLDGVGYTLDTEIHLHTIDAQTGASRRLTRGSFEVSEADWSPDGQRIAFTRTRDGRFAHRTDVWVVDADGGNARQLTSTIASAAFPRWSPDGRFIALIGSEHDGDAQMRLWLHDARTGDTRALGDDDIEVVSGRTVFWSHDSTRLYFVLAHHGRQEVATIAVADGTLQRVITGDRQVGHFALGANGLLYTSDDARTPADIWTAALDGGDERRLTDFNPWWRDRTMPDVTMRRFDVPDERGGTERVDGWGLTAPGAKGARPVLVDVHGGPASYALLSFNWHVYWPILISRGWAVLALNPVGSSSYGRDFSSRARKKWGKCDLDQQLAAVDALRNEGCADERVAIAGKSYGGFLGAWAVGNTTAFRAAVVCAPVADIESHFAVSDSGYYSDCYSMYGELSVKRDAMRDLSPLSYVEHVRTPTLILQGERDERCPVSQAEELFTGIMSATATPVELVTYPGGSHHFFESGRPSHRKDMLERLIGWLEKWIDRPLHTDDEHGSAEQAKASGRTTSRAS
ncbi:S9 family peptidase [Burkholderia multivorans]|uniref:S9 family peptidase n=1 Tax=Burkholderia multivorans TaxID=87883 RepID=UPI002864709F|nr:S9 family peptidase [Burkholderia multivorans]MDR8919075.1 Dipeptidyl-peptidase 5 [Burkholderia multivorans]MDR8925836.1 Dipeptidyl-peptidase 5 [Burkholderia multivorans]MDR8964600.1 Dipeptidyl-peptidase 5 [Burkholderia multivorans]MDR8992271.1 Dipeptidyl-peptidase 5 [Burkholderia multivorans]MDR9023101.1 Dipeptidyl-peptidase 5 [Burkholderia multivorans]